MEQLESELDLLIKKLKNSEKFSSEIDAIQNVYPFNRYEYIITRLVEEKILTYEDYLELRNEYINRNLFLYVFEIVNWVLLGIAVALTIISMLNYLIKNWKVVK